MVWWFCVSHQAAEFPSPAIHSIGLEADNPSAGSRPGGGQAILTLQDWKDEIRVVKIIVANSKLSTVFGRDIEAALRQAPGADPVQRSRCLYSATGREK